MNKLTLIAILFVAALLPAVLADSLQVTIQQPSNSSIHLQDDVMLKASSNKNGTLKYQLNSNSEVVVCNDCSSMQLTLNDLADGQHTVKVTALSGNETDTESVTFSVNESSQVNLSVVITQPTQSSIHLQDDVMLRANMNLLGTMKYKLDNNSEITACSSCSSFSLVLNNLANGQHTVKVTGTSGSKTDDATVTFSVNKSSTTTTVKPSNGTEDSRFAVGYNKLPQQFASGEISESELKSILENNKLNPGIINRLAKTGKLTPSLINTITETQFLPAGIAGKLLGTLGFGRNNAVDTLLKNYNLTDAQIASLIERSEMPKGAVNRLIKQNRLGSKSVDSLLSSQNLDSGTIKKLVESQTLTPDNVQKLINNQKLNKKIVISLIEQQLLDNETMSQLQTYGNGDIEKQLEKFQQRQENKKQRNQDREDSDDDEDEDDESEGRGKRVNLGKQKRSRD